ncbi:MAG TPA: hypothetical protein VIY72_06535 [Acidimicrobiales bacterium]
MYVFARHARLALGQTRAARMWATEITDRINQVTGLHVSLYAQIMSAEVGALDWGTAVPDLATLDTAMDKLLVDDFFVAEQDRSAGFLQGTPIDTLQSIVHGELDMHAAPPEYTTTITTVCQPGRLERGIAAGVELARRAEEITGAQSMMTIHETGQYGTVSWFTGYPGMESLEAAQAALMADPGWVRFVDERVADTYTDVPWASMQSIHRRVA